MRYNFDEIVDRKNTAAMKTDMASDGSSIGADVLSMWIADMDFACAPPIVEAIKKAADRRIFGYTCYGKLGYFEAVEGFYMRRHGWKIDCKKAVYSCGVVSGLDGVVATLTEKSDKILIQPPVYAPFSGVINSNGRTVVENPLIRREDGGYDMDFDDLARKAADPDVKMMILCSPHNPAGRVWTVEELTRVYDICRKNGVLLVCDEIHCDIVRRDVKHTPLLSLFPDAQDIIVCVAPTKTFNIAGLGVSLTVIPNDELRAKAEKALGGLTNPLSFAGATAAYSECDEWLDELLEYIDGNFEHLRAELAEKLPKAKLAPREGTYLAWVDLSAYRADSLAFEKELVEKGKLALEAGARFGTGGEGYQRICLACPRSLITEAVERIKKTVE